MHIRITRITVRPQNRGHSLYPKEGHKSRHRFFPQYHESGFFRSAMFDPAYVHPETAWISFVMHIRWTVCFLSFRAQSELCSSIWRALILTAFNCFFFRAAPCDKSFLRRHIKKARLREYHDESHGNPLLTACQAAENLLIDLLM